MADSNFKSPGVYIAEQNAFPNSVVPVATAVPAFIGYTPASFYEGKEYVNVAQKITSFADFRAIYCIPDPPLPAAPAKQYTPQYYLVRQKIQPSAGNFMLIDNLYYSILPDPNTIYYLYNSVKLFYENGGGDAYIVSVGGYGPPSKTPIEPSEQIINPNVQLTDLLQGLSVLLNEPEPTMYICPDATLLSIEQNGTLMNTMLLQCSEMQTVIAIFDVIGGKNPDPILYTNDIQTFRNNTGFNALDYGCAYYPFVGTTIMQNDDIDYTNLFGGDTKQLEVLLNSPQNPSPSIAAIMANIRNSASGMTVNQQNNALLNASTIYSYIIKNVLLDANLLPPSGGIAGVITTTDNTEGVWSAPANKSIVGVASLPIYLSDSQQENLNIDAVSGKSINAIRQFNGTGILIWGTRTLDGNSNDWKYIPVKRTMIYLEQSCSLAANAYVFEHNDQNTWNAVKSMIESFLTTVWSQGGLQGATSSDAFTVACGLGTTMTAEDILNGYMKILINVAILRPAEFMAITINKKMEVA